MNEKLGVALIFGGTLFSLIVLITGIFAPVVSRKLSIHRGWAVVLLSTATLLSTFLLFSIFLGRMDA